MRGGNINTAKKLRGSSMQRIFILLWLSWGLVGAAGAQEFSSRPVMIVAFSAGGPADIVARTLAQGMGKCATRRSTFCGRR
jgi:tripartite-type tricarboxylate transporter receptor subunit TctC